MHIFVYEHMTANGNGAQATATSLEREGRAMLDAFAEDVARMPGVAVQTLLDPASDFDKLARVCDGTVVIAPELDGTLSRLSRRVLEVGGRLLGAAVEAIDLASDKLAMAECLTRRGVPCLATEALLPGRIPACGLPVVIKPRRGAGSTGVRRVLDPDELHHLGKENIATEYIATRFHEGLAASMLLIAGPRGILPLRAGEQLLADDGTFQYLGGRLPLPPRLEFRARRLALRAVNAVPGLLGFVGVDMLLDRSESTAPDDRIVEINARLTTSYVGLRALAESNLAEHWLRTIHGEFPAAPIWRTGGVAFSPDGTIKHWREGQ